ncbi:MAG: efflux RND transporter periplasmic adaptor subunit [Planctomycetota bacterium]|nr:efflux RND transporter periplasmic adaptor subunit [Planctomycetota bacterium]
MSTEARSAHPDLEALRRKEPVAPTPGRRWLPRLVTFAIVVALLGAAFAVLQPLLFPARTVRVVGVRPVQAGEGRAVSAHAVQAAGWVEADPYPLTVRPLVRGVVETLAVLEGSTVKRGETIIAVLRNAEIENAFVAAEAQHALMASVYEHRKTTLAVMKSILEQKISLRAEVAQRQGELATARAEVDGAAARRGVAEATLARARVELDAQRELEKAGHATPTALALAKARVREAEERVKEVRFDEVRVVADLSRLNNLLELAREAVRDPRALQGKVDEAEAAMHHAHADVKRAQADLAIAQRNVDLLTIRAPMTGVVLRLEAAPGALVGPAGEFKGSGEGAGSTGLLNRLTGALCSIFDPAKLQVRVDVPYSDLPGIAEGTVVELEAKAVPGKRFGGIVDRLVREADITQAKLQVKVRVTDPDPRLRPEMLCTARFLVKPEGPSKAVRQGGGPTRLLVPTEALRGDAVFVFDPRAGGKARRVSVRVFGADDGWTEVEGELGLSSKVIVDEVTDGEPIKPTSTEVGR